MALLTNKEILEPPQPPYNLRDFTSLNRYLTQVYNFNYIVWERVGRYFEGDTGFNNMVYQNSNNVAITGGFLENVTIDASSINGASIELSTIGSSTIENSMINTSNINDSNLIDCETNQGDSGSFIKLGGNAYTSTNNAGNVGGSLTDMLQYAMPSNSMNDDGTYIEIEGWGTLAANGNNKRITFYFGSTLVLDTGLIAANSGSWVVNVTVIRSSAGSQKAIAKIVSNNTSIVASATSALLAENTANSINVKFASQGVANNDVIQEGMTVKFYNK